FRRGTIGDRTIGADKDEDNGFGVGGVEGIEDAASQIENGRSGLDGFRRGQRAAHRIPPLAAGEQRQQSQDQRRQWHSTKRWKTGVAHSHGSRSRWRRTPLLQNGVHYLLRQIRFLRQGLLRCFLALADQLAVELQPGSFLFHDAVFDADVEDASLLVDAVVEKDVELGFRERRRHFVL